MSIAFDKVPCNGAMVFQLALEASNTAYLQLETYAIYFFKNRMDPMHSVEFCKILALFLLLRWLFKFVSASQENLAADKMAIRIQEDINFHRWYPFNKLSIAEL